MCEWRGKHTWVYHCKVPPEPGSNYCIFHEPGTKETEQFKEKFYDQINEIGPVEKRNERYDFRGYVFPTGICSTAETGKVVSSRGEEVLKLPARMEGGLRFNEATVKGDVSFVEATIEGNVSFWGAEISGDANFWGAQIKGGIFFDETVIDGRVMFEEAEIQGDVDFRGAKIMGEADFWGAAIVGNMDLSHAMVKGNGDFGCVRIVKNADFEGTTIKGQVDFGYAAISKNLDFRHFQASTLTLGKGRPTIFPLAQVRRGIRIGQTGYPELFWLFACLAFQKQGMRNEADAAHYFERVVRISPRRIPLTDKWWYRRNYRALLKRLFILFFQWLPDCLFLRWPIAYGASLSRLFTTWAVLIGSFAAVYYQLTLRGVNLFDSASPGLHYTFSFGRALYFSIITFTTLGYGDIRPASGLGSALTATEAVLGGIMMALTVLVIGRKFMR